MAGSAPLRPNPAIEPREQPRPDPAYKWVLVATLFFVGLINYADRTSITAVYALLKTDLGFTDIGLGAIGSLFLWSYALASPFAGYVGDRVDRGRVILWSLTAWSLVTLLTGFVTAKWQLLGMRVFLGLAESLYLPAAMAVIAEYHPHRTLATAQGIHTVGTHLGLVVGGALAGYLGERYGWRVSLTTLGCSGLVLAAAAYFLLPRRRSSPVAADRKMPMRKPGPSFPTAALRLVKIPSFLVLALAGLLPSIGAWIFINWLPLYFRENFDMSLARAGFLGSSILSITSSASQMVGAVFSDLVARKGEHYRMLIQAILIFLAGPVLLTFLFTRRLTLILAALVFYSVLRTCGDLNIIPLLCNVSGQDKLSTAFGITNMMNNFAGGAGVFVAGVLKAKLSLTGVFASVTGILILDSLILFLGYFVFLKKDLQKASVLVPAADSPAITEEAP